MLWPWLSGIVSSSIAVVGFSVDRLWSCLLYWFLAWSLLPRCRGLWKQARAKGISSVMKNRIDSHVSLLVVGFPQWILGSTSGRKKKGAAPSAGADGR
jgi:hypothetical protein